MSNQQPVDVYLSTDYSNQYDEIYRNTYQQLIENGSNDNYQWISLLGNSIILNTPPPMKQVEFDIQANVKDKFESNLNKLYDAESSENYRSVLKDERKVFYDDHNSQMHAHSNKGSDAAEAMKYQPGYPYSPKYHDPFAKLLVIMKRMKKTPYYKDLTFGEKLAVLINPKYLFQASKPHIQAPVEIDINKTTKLNNMQLRLQKKLADLPNNVNPDYRKSLEEKIAILKKKQEYVPQSLKKKIYSSSTRRKIIEGLLLKGGRQGVDISGLEPGVVKRQRIVDLNSDARMDEEQQDALNQIQILEEAIGQIGINYLYNTTIVDPISVFWQSLLNTNIPEYKPAVGIISNQWNEIKNKYQLPQQLNLKPFISKFEAGTSLKQILQIINQAVQWGDFIPFISLSSYEADVLGKQLNNEAKTHFGRILKELYLAYFFTSKDIPEYLKQAIQQNNIDMASFIKLMPYNEVIQSNNKGGQRRILMLGQPDQFDPRLTIAPMYDRARDEYNAHQMNDPLVQFDQNVTLIPANQQIDDMQLPASIEVQL